MGHLVRVEGGSWVFHLISPQGPKKMDYIIYINGVYFLLFSTMGLSICYKKGKVVDGGGGGEVLGHVTRACL